MRNEMRVCMEGATVLVTGASGGLGKEFVVQALRLGAVKVYAAARTPMAWSDTRVVPIQLDVTDPEAIDAAVQQVKDVGIVINNAGVASGASLLTGDEEELRAVLETNLWGALAVTRAFKPQLVAARGALLNVLSSSSWHGRIAAYSVSKAALMIATNSIRLELDAVGVLVTALHVGWVRTPMTEGLSVEKLEPSVVVRAAYDGLQSGLYEVLVDESSRRNKRRAALPISEMYPELASGS